MIRIDLDMDILVTFTGHIKGTTLSAFRLSLPAFPPSRSMLHYPIEEGSFKADIITGFFALNPFVAEDLFALGQELLIKHRILYQLCGIFTRGFHYYNGSLYI
jgi:hypothetical protein